MGTTHLAVWSANYLASCCQKKTAVVEWSSHSDFVHLCLDDKNGQTARAFRLLEVDYYPQGEKEALASCIRSGYEEILDRFWPRETGNTRRMVPVPDTDSDSIPVRMEA